MREWQRVTRVRKMTRWNISQSWRQNCTWRLQKCEKPSESYTRSVWHADEELERCDISAVADSDCGCVRQRVVGLMQDFPELQMLMDSMVPSALLPIFRFGRKREHFTDLQAMHKPSRNTLYRAKLVEDDGSRDVVLKARV